MINYTRIANLTAVAREKMADPRVKIASERFWNVQNQSDDTTEIQIFDIIGDWGVTAQDFTNEIKQITTPKITLSVNSQGGSVFDGFAIFNAIEQHPAHVTARVVGLAASAASFIIMAADEVVMTQVGQMMIHDASGMCFGNASEMRELADVLDELSDTIAEIYAAKAGGDVASWRAVMRGTKWYDANAAVEAGLADRVHERPTKRAKQDDASEGDTTNKLREEPVKQESAWDVSTILDILREV